MAKDIEMFVLLAATLVTIIFAIKKLRRRSKEVAMKSRRPPSPWKLPVIGNLHQLSLHPHRSLQSLSRRYGPLMLLHFGQTPVLIVSSHDFAQQVMKTHDVKFASRPKTKVVDQILNGGRDIAFAPYGEYWRQLKTICIQNLLSTKMVASFGNIRQEEINLLINKLDKASMTSASVNLSQLLITLINDVTCRVALGRKYSNDKDAIDVESIVKTISELLGAFPVGEYIPSLAWIDRIRGLDSKIEKVNTKFGDFLENVVQEHDAKIDKKRLDFVDILLSVQRDETSRFKFDTSDLKLVLWDMFVAGTGTTVALLEWTMTELIKHPEIMKKLQDEIRLSSEHNVYVTEDETEDMKYLKAVIKEALRLHPSAPLLAPRFVSEDVKLEKYDIAAGTQVFINAWAIQRDSATWGIDAEEFRPERHLDSPLDFNGQDFKYIPFGSGRRLCPGIGSALAMIRVTLANLVKRFDWRIEIRPPWDQYDLAEATSFGNFRKFPLIAFPTSM